MAESEPAIIASLLSRNDEIRRVRSRQGGVVNRRSCRDIRPVFFGGFISLFSGR